MVGKIILLLKRYWFIIFLATITLGLLVIRIAFKKPPSPQLPPISTVSLIDAPEFNGIDLPSNIKVNIEDLSFPSKLKIYKGQEKKFSSEEANEIAQKLNFKELPKQGDDIFLGKFYLWATKEKALSIYIDSGKIEYGMDLYQTKVPKEGTLPSPTESRKFLENFLKEINLEPQYEPKWQTEKYLLNDYYFQISTDSKKADFIEVGFNPGIDQYQLTSQNPQDPLVYIVLNKKSEVVRFAFQVFFTDLKDEANYDIKSKEEFNSSLFKEGKIVYTEVSQKTLKEPEIKEVIFDKVNLAYFQDPAKKTVLQPIFILNGNGILKDEKKVEIIAYLPAISSKWLKHSQEHFKTVPMQQILPF